MARVVRGEVLSIKEMPYVEAARSLGATNLRLIVRHILPNAVAPVFVSASFGVAGAILVETSLSFLGFGAPPPNPSWGNMMQGSLGNFQNSPWLVITPGLFIFFTTLGIYLFGDGLRDAMDPWIKK